LLQRDATTKDQSSVKKIDDNVAEIAKKKEESE
jgi:hypothetical protein